MVNTITEIRNLLKWLLSIKRDYGTWSRIGILVSEFASIIIVDNQSIACHYLLIVIPRWKLVYGLTNNFLEKEEQSY